MHYPAKIAVIGPNPPPYGGMANQAELLIRGLREKKIECVSIPTNRSFRILETKVGGLPGIRTLFRLLTYYFRLFWIGSGCDVFHIMACSHLYYFVNVVPAILAGRMLKKRIFVNYRGGEAASFFRNRGKKGMGLLSLAHVLVVPGQYLKKVFNDLGIEAAIVPNIIPLDRFLFRLPGGDQAKTITFIGTRQFEPYYDVETLIRAFALASKDLDQARLILIGEGSLYTSLKQLTAELEINDQVIFKGKVRAEEIPACLEQADIFVNSSVVDNYPNSLLESFAAGLPVISTNAGGIPYLVTHLENGILVNTSNPEALAEEMIRLAKDPDLCRRLAIAGKETAVRHSWDKIWPKLKEQYKIALKKGDRQFVRNSRHIS